MRSTLNLIKHLDLVEISHINLQKLILHFFYFSIKSYSLFNSENQQVLVTSIFPFAFSFFFFIFLFLLAQIFIQTSLNVRLMLNDVFKPFKINESLINAKLALKWLKIQ
jgi:hypothetical protein